MKVSKIIAAAMCLAASLAIAGCACSGTAPSSGSGAVPKDPTAKVPITVEAEGWGEGSTPVIVKVVSDDGKVEFAHALDANRAGELALADGSYRLTVITPINADGSIYSVPDAGTLTVKDGKAGAIELSLDRIAADDVTAEQMERAVRDIAAATAVGDGTLSGAKGKAVQEAAAKNAAAAGKVDGAEASKAAEEASSEAAAAFEASHPAASPQGQGGSSTASSGNGSGGGSSQPSGGGTSDNGGGSSSSGSATSDPAPQQHVHTWATRTVDDGDVWVVDQAAWDEKVAVGSHDHCTCGLDWYDMPSLIAHQKQAGCRSTVVTDYEWVHHDEVGHYEHLSHTETYCTECGAVQ